MKNQDTLLASDAKMSNVCTKHEARALATMDVVIIAASLPKTIVCKTSE